MTPARAWTAIAVLVLPMATKAIDLNPECTDGPSREISGSPGTRPERTVECSYSFSELIERMVRLAGTKTVPYSVELVQEVLSIPEMTTAYDDTRVADYTMTLHGKGGWKLGLEVRESFPPLDKGPPRFNAGLHPKRLFSIEDAHLLVDLDAITCIPSARLISSLKDSGWGALLSVPSDGLQAGPAFAYHGKKVAFDEGCTSHILLQETPHSSKTSTPII